MATSSKPSCSLAWVIPPPRRPASQGVGMMSRSEDVAGVAPFSREEFAERQRRVRQRARDQGFDALLIADPANLYYLTGYNAWSFYVPQVLHLPVDGAPTLVTREM